MCHNYVIYSYMFYISFIFYFSSANENALFDLESLGPILSLKGLTFCFRTGNVFILTWCNKSASRMFNLESCPSGY